MKHNLLLFLALFMSLSITAQQRNVSGVVVDKSGEPIIGASVMEKGTRTGAATDINGHFSFAITNEKPVLVVTSVGYLKLDTTVTSLSDVKIVLTEDNKLLNEVVVVGYGTMKKSDLTGSVSSIKSDELTRLSSVDVNQSIQGKAAGVSVINNSGEPGAGTKIRIRGTGSVNNSDPLYVVDGFPQSDISNLAPHDIQSMEILKDASAVAIYGSRGANGVILITTKNGSFNKKTKVNVNVFGGFTKVAKEIDMLNAHDYATLKLESYANANQTVSQDMQAILGYVIDHNSIGTNWQDEIFRTGTTQNYNVSLSGGSERNKFDIGGTYSTDAGIVKNTFLDKFMFHINNEYKLFKNVSIGVNASYTTYEKSGNDGDFYSGSITQALKADPVSAAWDSYTNQFGQIYFSYGRNPAQSADENKYRSTSEDRFIANAFLQIDHIGIDGLSFRSQFSKQLIFAKSRNYYPQYFITADQQRSKSNLTENRSDNNNWTTSNYFSYVNTFGLHSINATLGMEAQKMQSSYEYASVYDVPENINLRYLSMSSDKVTLTANGGASHNALLSGFVRANYNYANRYLLTGTFRADGSSKFKKKWGYFPSFSAGWNILEENFMSELKNNSPLSQLKLRTGWGHVGNQSSAGNFDYVALMTTGYTYVFGGSQVDGAILQKLANDELSWETSEQYNIGLDFGFFNNALSGTIDYFIRNTNDMILNTPVPIYAGIWKTNTNAGSVQNRGTELNLNYQKSIGNDFSFNIGGNISFINNEVTSLGGGDPLYGNLGWTKTEVGKEIGYFYGLQTAGIFKTQEQLDAHVKDGVPIQPNAALGDVIFVDRDKNGVIDDNDRTYLGSATPKFTYGINLSAAYKGFDINLFFQGSQGNKIANYMYSVMYSSSMREWSNSAAMINRWTPTNSNSDLPRVVANDPNKNDQFSDRYIEDGSYFRLKTMQLGYSLPAAAAKKLFANDIRLYVSADNLLTLTKYSGFNPEIGDLYGNPLNPGIDMATYPTPKVFTIGCNLNF